MKIGLAPLIDYNSKVILLGTMPSEESLRKQEYYGHKSNQFWKIIFSLYKKPLILDYRERVAFLYQTRIALWDVLHTCEGNGSSDSNIINGKPNDIGALLTKYPKIKHIFFTSRNAQIFYKRYIDTEIPIGFSVLPSPSSAYASMNLESKIEKWRDSLGIYIDIEP